MTDQLSDSIPVTQIDDKTVTVNGIEISEFAIEAEMAQLEGEEKAFEKAAATLVIRHLLLEQAKEADISMENGDEKAIEELLATALSMPEADDEFRKSYFEKNREQFRSPDLYEVSHILLAAAPDDLDLRAELRVKAEELIAVIQQDESTFEALAKEHSACPSAKMGGNLGQITSGTTVPEFERQLFSLPEGFHHNPIESRYGYHIVNVNRMVAGKPLEFEMVSESIAAHLYRHTQKQAVSQYIEELVKQAKVIGVDMQAVRNKAGL